MTAVSSSSGPTRTSDARQLDHEIAGKFHTRVPSLIPVPPGPLIEELSWKLRPIGFLCKGSRFKTICLVRGNSNRDFLFLPPSGFGESRIKVRLSIPIERTAASRWTGPAQPPSDMKTPCREHSMQITLPLGGSGEFCFH